MLLRMQGHLSISDRRITSTPGSLQSMLLHNKRINTVHCAPEGGSSGHDLVTSSSDTSVKIWDMRMMRQGSKKSAALKPVAELFHTKSCHGAVLFAACMPGICVPASDSS